FTFIFYILLSLLFLVSLFFFYCSPHPPHLHSFPTRRSSDLPSRRAYAASTFLSRCARSARRWRRRECRRSGTRYSPTLRRARAGDRKSTRLNSSHVASAYAVFCLKKKNKKKKKTKRKKLKKN